MFGLLGPNGAGKSTLMRTLGYLPQGFGVYPRAHKSYIDQLVFWLKTDTSEQKRTSLMNT